MDNLKFYALYFAYILTIVLFSACKKTEDKGWFKYDVTQCADPWHDEVEKGSTIETAALEYLTVNGIELDHIQKNSAPKDFTACVECTCPNGEKIIIKLQHKNEDEAAVKALGFYGL